LKRTEILDGCPSIGDKIEFRIPLKGIENISPSMKNVFNKFSVKYFVKVCVEIKEDEEIITNE
jgi:vacuolar protein sorting-associated protein 26